MKTTFPPTHLFVLGILLLSLSGQAKAQTEWQGNTDQWWGTNSNWSTGSQPNSVGATAYFYQYAAYPAGSVEWGGTKTVGDILFSTTNKNVTLGPDAAVETLTLNNSTGNARIRVAARTDATIQRTYSINSNVVLADNTDIDVALTGDPAEDAFLHINGVLSESVGGRAINKTGSGILTFTANNTYTGNTNVSGGTLEVTGTGKLYTTGFQANARLNVNNGGTIELDNWQYGPGTTSLGGLRANNYAININNGTIRVNGIGDSDYSRGFTIDSGGATLESAAGGADWIIDSAGDPIVVNGNGSLTLGGDGNGTLGKAFSSGGSLSKTGSGTWTLTANNTYTGNTTVSGGKLDLTTGSLYDNAYNPNARVTIENGSTLDITRLSYGSGNSLGQLTNNTYEVWDTTPSAGSPVPGSAHLVLDDGTLAIQGPTHGGGRGFIVTSNGGTIDIVNSGSTVTWSGDSATGGGNFQDIYIWGALTLQGDGNGVINDKDIRGNGSIVKDGSGTWTISGSNTYSGSTTVDNGKLVISGTNRGTSAIMVNPGATLETGATNMFVAGHGTPVNDSMVVTVDNATWLMNSNMESRIGNVTLMNGATWTSNRGLSGYDVLLADTTSGPATVTIANTGGNTSGSMMDGTGGIHLLGTQNFDIANVTGDALSDLTVSMVLDDGGTSGGSGGINKNGAGTMTLSNNNTYTGITNVRGGTLNVTGEIAGAGTVTVQSGATLAGSDAGATAADTSVAGFTTLNPGGIISVGDATESGHPTARSTFSIAGGLESNGGTLMVDVVDFSSFYQGTFSGEGPIVNLNLTLDDVIDSPTSNDLLIVGNAAGDLSSLMTADLTGGFHLDIDSDGNPLPFMGFFDVLVASEILIDEDTFSLSGASFWRIVNLEGGGQTLQVATPEPGAILIWSLIAFGLLGGAVWSRRKGR